MCRARPGSKSRYYTKRGREHHHSKTHGYGQENISNGSEASNLFDFHIPALNFWLIMTNWVSNLGSYFANQGLTDIEVERKAIL